MRVALILCFALLTKLAPAQLFISPGAQVRMTGNARLTLYNSDMINNGNFQPGPGTVSFTGNGNSIIGGTQVIVFNDLEINKTNAGKVLMQQLIDIAHTVHFISGYLDLNGHVLDLGSMGSLQNEQETSHITGINGGQVLYSAQHDNPINVNPANLGATITCGQNLGTVLIRRGHQSQMNNYGNGSSIHRYYDIIPMNNIPFTATLRINYFDAELNGLPENGLVFWNRPDQLHWINEDLTSGNSNLNYMEKAGIHSFGRWTLSSSNNPLPVKFTLFNLKCEGNKVILSWKTAHEQNSSHYTIEKSTDARSWAAIGNIPAAGNSNTEKNYLFIDNSPVQNSYYRIAGVDIDGKINYTNTIRSSCSIKDRFTVWPNPFTDKIIIDLPADRQSRATIKVFDSKGALVKKEDATVLSGINQLVVRLENLPAGVYNLSAEWGNGENGKTTLIIKQ